tara:strand:- start:3330 stop:3638 length:309 start_codon:yes stop_codon:yes gene_type:complete
MLKELILYADESVKSVTGYSYNEIGYLAVRGSHVKKVSGIHQNLRNPSPANPKLPSKGCLVLYLPGVQQFPIQFSLLSRGELLLFRRFLVNRKAWFTKVRMI